MLLIKLKMFPFILSLLNFYFYFIFLMAALSGIWKFIGQRLNQSHSCNLHHASAMPDLLTHCPGLGIKPAPLQQPLRCCPWILFFFFFFFFVFLGPHWWHMEVPRLGVQSELTDASHSHSHSNTGSELCLRPIPQLTALSDP